MAERSINPEINKIDFRSNEKRYREVFGGRRNRWLEWLSDTPWAYETREVLINIATKERELKREGTIHNIAENVAIQPTMLSRAAGGLLSDKPMEEYNGKSPRGFVLDILKKYYYEEYQQPEFNI